jgi:SAM-dependent methyltransferase
LGFRDELYGQYVSTFKGAAYAADDWWSYKYLPLLADLPRDAAILEIGCGGGELLAFLGRHGFDRARGVDISAEQVALAQAHGVPAEVADVFVTLRERQAAYDALLAVDVLEHFTRDELMRLAPRLFDALKPGGRLLVQTANGAGLFPRQVIYGDLTHLTIFTPESLGQLLRPCGFEHLRFYETGPIPLRVRGKVNVAVWSALKLAANAIRSVETGKRQAIWTENFICLAFRPADR